MLLADTPERHQTASAPPFRGLSVVSRLWFAHGRRASDERRAGLGRYGWELVGEKCLPAFVRASGAIGVCGAGRPIWGWVPPRNSRTRGDKEAWPREQSRRAYQPAAMLGCGLESSVRFCVCSGKALATPWRHCYGTRHAPGYTGKHEIARRGSAATSP